MLENLINSNIDIIGANQTIVDIGDYKAFYSYDKLIATYKKSERKLYLKNDMWDYSNTTRKYFKKFVDNYTTFAYDTKAKFLNLISSDDNVIEL